MIIKTLLKDKEGNIVPKNVVLGLIVVGVLATFIYQVAG